MQLQFRHELKHIITAADRLVLLNRLRAVTRPDEHADNGLYDIYSLYFDNLYDKALNEKIIGIPRREKFRIRYYNNNLDYINLEKKSKIDGLCNKQSCSISRCEVEKIINDNLDWMPVDGRPLIKELYSKMKGQGLRPATIVAYTREAFVYPYGNVRITIDYNIRLAMGVNDFLMQDKLTIPVTDDSIILEVKWDEYLPDIIKDIIGLNNRQATSFSKYAACRTAIRR